MLPEEFSGEAVVYEVGVGYVLLAGERRFAARQLRGERTVLVYVLRNWLDFVAWMARDKYVTERNRQRHLPMDHMAAAAFDAKAQALLNPPRSELPTADVAEYTDFRPENVSTARSLLRVQADTSLVPELRLVVESVIAEVRSGLITPHGAWGRYTRERKRIEAPRMSADEQLKILGNVGSQLAGMADGLATVGEINPSMTVADMDRYIDTLVRGKGALDKVLRALRAAKTSKENDQ